MGLAKTLRNLTIGPKGGKAGLNSRDEGIEADSPSGTQGIKLFIDNHDGENLLGSKAPTDLNFEIDDFEDQPHDEDEPAVLKNLPKQRKKSKKRPSPLRTEKGATVVDNIACNFTSEALNIDFKPPAPAEPTMARSVPADYNIERDDPDDGFLIRRDSEMNGSFNDQRHLPQNARNVGKKRPTLNLVVNKEEEKPADCLAIKPMIETDFIFGSDAFSNDGSFHDGGFRITKTGIVQTPGLARVNSMGQILDGVPQSTTNIIVIQTLRDIEYIGSLGAGASGQVQLAVHRPSRSKMAVKIVNVYDEERKKQLLKELATLTTYISRFLVRFYGAFYDGSGAVHVVLEYMESGSLEDAIRYGGRVPEEVTKQIAAHCLHGLKFLHQNNVMHRDLKSANILLSRRLNRSKLADFGLVKELGEVSKAATFVGTLAYMSPERLKGSQYTSAGDIWGLGISVCECLLGKFPFAKPDSYFDYLENALRGDVLVSTIDISSEARDFISACLKIEPKDRPSAKELLEHPFINSKADVNEFAMWLERVRAMKKKRQQRRA
eukprot:Plantae.Rhodophyta-Purpureofilum_apyrenoidigerum.ctg2965.p1 GENE.Plantae.Rhodophyta-Purpureofilum_apyrenoidigerum.ctg2965~~Plantae.Rhodophyta-Purpureofilum_apyrenoidigerum.ctg2965.p1  ORF type:complete len:549 (+),score=102.21 Plantae.Rhodophyta-Purpureofilum_apyrenoidigerum.ctg2965:316-1962(+)